MNLVEAWKKSKLGGRIERPAQWGRIYIIKGNVKEWLMDIPLIASLTMESFLADDWEIKKESKQTTTCVFTSFPSTAPRMVYLPIQIPLNTSVKITWEWEE